MYYLEIFFGKVCSFLPTYLLLTQFICLHQHLLINLFYSLDYNSINLFFFSLKLLQLWLLWACLDLFHCPFGMIFLALKDSPGKYCILLALTLEPASFWRSCSYFYRGMIFRNQDLSCGCSYCSMGCHCSWAFSADSDRISFMYTNSYLHTYPFFSTYIIHIHILYTTYMCTHTHIYIYAIYSISPYVVSWVYRLSIYTLDTLFMLYAIYITSTV